MEERKYVKEGDGEHITNTETKDPPVPNRARTEMTVGDPPPKGERRDPAPREKKS